MNLQALKIDRDPKSRAASRRRRGGGYFLPTVLTLALAVVVWVFWPRITQFVDRFRLPSVATFRVAESHPAAVGAISGTAANGYVIAARQAALSADTPGRVVEVNVTEGSVVKKGDVVARLFSEEYAAALQRTEADLVATRAGHIRAQAALEAANLQRDQRSKLQDAAAAQVRERKANYDQAGLDQARIQDLFDQGISSGAELDQAKSTFQAVRASYQNGQASKAAADAILAAAESQTLVANGDLSVAAARLDVAIAARNQAAATLEKTIVRAPFDGVVVEKAAEVGEVVSPNSQGGSNARGSLCTMVDFASLEVQVDLPETSLGMIVVGDTVQIFLDAYLDSAYVGRVDRIWPIADRQKATIELRIVFAAPDDKLRPEMGARVVFSDAPVQAGGPAVILIPEDAVVEIGGQTGVFVLGRGTVQFQPVVTGKSKNGRVQISEGLQPGKTIVTAPPPSLQDGDRVLTENQG